MITPLKDIVPTIFKEHAWKIQLLNNWQTILGNLSNNVCIEKINDDTLTLGVYDSCWIQELYLLSHVLLKTINEKLDKPRIKRLRFKLVGIKKTKTKHTPIAPKKDKSMIVNLSHAEQQALNHIKDQQLRQALENFLIRCYRERT